MKKSFLKIGIPAIIFFGIDQLSKWWVVTNLTTPIHFTDWAAIRYEQNIGIAWSIFIPQPWLSILNIALLIFLPYYISKNIDLRRNDSQIILSMILGGALGNLFDRLTRGFVVDFISIGTFPVFNIADSLLTIGIFLILVFYGRIRRDSRT